MKKFLITSILLCIYFTKSLASESLNQAKFPEDFLFGVASAAFQIEGAWNSDGKGENIWDRWTHEKPDRIQGNATADVACDSYHRLDEDIAMIKNLEVDFYRFSISWSRILPDGTTNKINQKGIDYYNNLIDKLIANNITPMATLYHWDLPQKLQEYGGWVNPHLADFFEDYARTAFEHFGDRVKFWITFNEPMNFCLFGYGSFLKAPGVNLTERGYYYCAHTVLKAHARAYRLYKTEFGSKFGGRVSLSLDSPWFEPASDSKEDIAATERIWQFILGIFAHPIYVNGDYPELLKETVASNSKAEGFRRSRLPQFSEEEQKFILGTADFFALNTYTSVQISEGKKATKSDQPSVLNDINFKFIIPEDWPGSASDWLKVVPWGFSKLLKKIKENYGDVDIFVTENGYSDTKGELNDVDRISYYHLYLSALLDAVESGVRVKAYTFWTLMDNFEWTEGYDNVFGLYAVNFSDPALPRTPKKSVEAIKEIVRNHKLPIAINTAGANFIQKDEL